MGCSEVPMGERSLSPIENEELGHQLGNVMSPPCSAPVAVSGCCHFNDFMSQAVGFVTIPLQSH